MLKVVSGSSPKYNPPQPPCKGRSTSSMAHRCYVVLDTFCLATAPGPIGRDQHTALPTPQTGTHAPHILNYLSDRRRTLKHHEICGGDLLSFPFFLIFFSLSFSTLLLNQHLDSVQRDWDQYNEPQATLDCKSG